MRRRRSVPRLRPDASWVLTTLVAVQLSIGAASLPAQEESPTVQRALELENAGKFREAAPLFRDALRAAPSAGALLGLERVYAELGWSDSLVAPLESLVARHPRDPLYRSVQLRTLQILRRDDALRTAFDRWAAAAPRDPAPYREYARILLALGRSASADSVVRRGRALLGDAREFEFEDAQLRAARGEWTGSAASWRRALVRAPHLAGAASYALAPTPAAVRDSVRSALLTPPADRGARQALAELELSWGRPREAWEALRALPADTATAAVWAEFGTRALDEERFALARDALGAAVRLRRSPDLALLAARASLRAGSPADVLSLLPLAEVDADPARAARDYLPLHVGALAALGRAREAEVLVERYDRALAPGQRAHMAAALADAWVRAGDMARARASLRAAGPDADSSETAGWLALYEGRLGDARALLKAVREPGPELAAALGVIARTRGDAAAALGGAFLALARGDTAKADTAFMEASGRHAEAASAILLAAARLRAARGDEPGALVLWERIVASHGDSPESPEAELEWARLLRRRGDNAGALARLEHLILSAPNSALLPQARRELELARGAVPTPRGAP